MKEMIRKTFGLRRLALALCLAYLTCSPSGLAQITDDDRHLLEVKLWELKYTVEIKGRGKQEPEVGSGGPLIEWVVDRVYTGLALLNIGGPSHDPRYSGLVRLKMTVNDKITKTSDPLCEEYTEEIETWTYTGEGLGPSGGAMELIRGPGWPYIGQRPANVADISDIVAHSARFPVSYFTTRASSPKQLEPRLLVYQKDIFYHPKNLVKRGEPEIRPNAINLNVPSIPDWIESTQSRRADVVRKGKPVPKIIGGGLSFDSLELPIPTSLLEGVDTTKEAKARIKYTLRPFVCDPKCYPVVRQDNRWVPLGSQ